MIKKDCKFCKKVFSVYPYRREKAIFCSYKCLGQWSKENLSGGKSLLWQGEKTNYYNLHKRLVKYFGHPKQCEHCGKIGIKEGRRWNIEWALKRGEEYEYKIENFLHLCRFCHKKYDWVDLGNRNKLGEFVVIYE